MHNSNNLNWPIDFGHWNYIRSLKIRLSLSYCFQIHAKLSAPTMGAFLISTWAIWREGFCTEPKATIIAQWDFFWRLGGESNALDTAGDANIELSWRRRRTCSRLRHRKYAVTQSKKAPGADRALETLLLSPHSTRSIPLLFNQICIGIKHALSKCSASNTMTWKRI